MAPVRREDDCLDQGFTRVPHNLSAMRFVGGIQPKGTERVFDQLDVVASLP